ncbi:hypothetical protein [Leptolyngbya sp. FACHB-261]|uniref:hypothetical protein n=1 Tax=Leptolyngbya sp. FACHB-261 TaxID=2692806 RepID=UPI001686AA47|nr:hypothetical protein [Leptolyngbya sp. FACHB-261]MBD2103091.1 hypothetical protein [Leptolyngbya sp. FACHB-261]
MEGPLEVLEKINLTPYCITQRGVEFCPGAKTPEGYHRPDWWEEAFMPQNWWEEADEEQQVFAALVFFAVKHRSFEDFYQLSWEAHIYCKAVGLPLNYLYLLVDDYMDDQDLPTLADYYCRAYVIAQEWLL